MLLKDKDKRILITYTKKLYHTLSQSYTYPGKEKGQAYSENACSNSQDDCHKILRRQLSKVSSERKKKTTVVARCEELKNSFQT